MAKSELRGNTMNDIGQQFFKVFGIEKICTHTVINPERCNHRRMARCCDCDWHKYPEITAEKLLQIMIIYSKDFVFSVQNEENTETLKRDILKCVIDCAKYKKYAHLKHQVRSLFNEGK